MSNTSPNAKDIGEVSCQQQVTSSLTWFLAAEAADLNLSNVNTDDFNPYVRLEMQGRGMTHLHVFVHQPNSTVSRYNEPRNEVLK